MFVKLTNAVAEREGDPIYLNSDSIQSVYSQSNKQDGNIVVTTTLYGITGQTWIVKESLEKTVEILNQK